MTREDLKKLFPDATDDQITKMLNMHNSEINIERNKVTAMKDKADSADELQKQIDELQQQLDGKNNDKDSELQKLRDQIAKLERQNAVAAQKKSAMEKFRINAEQVDKIINDDGVLDYDALAQIISEKETAAATAKEQEIAKNQGNPGGGSGNKDKEDDKPDDVKNIETITFGGISKDAQAAQDYYK